ncbi:MAG: PHP domain-containing protein [Bacillota bacterium]
MTIDLHIHTTSSDGNLRPEQVVELAAQAGLQVISLADHESTDGYARAAAAGRVLGVEVIPGVELVTSFEDHEIHLLGYCFNVKNRWFQKQLNELRKARTQCARKTVEKLNEFGFKIAWDDVLPFAQDGSTVSKGHIMQAMHEAGYIHSKMDAVNILKKYLNQQGLAYTCHDYPFAYGVELIKKAGGIPVLAHPGLIGDDEVVERLLELGVEGIEVYYYYFGPRRAEFIARYGALAGERKLLMTGGSDYHGTITPVVLGELYVPPELAARLKEYKSIRRQASL